MANCPFCQADLSVFPVTPAKCPKCGLGLDTGSNRTIPDDSGDFLENDPNATVESGEHSASASMSEPSDSIGQTVQSEEFSWSADAPGAAAPGGGSREFDVSMIDQTVQSDEFGSLPDVSAMRPESGDPGKTMQSDEFEPAGSDKTVQSDEFSWSEDAPGGAKKGLDPGKTVASGEFEGSEIDRTVQSDEFSSSEVPGGGFGNQQTVMSDEWDEASRADQTMMSDELPPDAIKTMQTMWSGAFQGPTNPGMSIKGATKASHVTGSTLVIKQRQLSSPGEKAAPNKEAEYELIRVLGEGGMGVVYDARQTSVDRSVAVKMLKPKTSGDERQRQKFLAEAVVTGDLDHPNIVPIYDVGTSERGLLFYAMKKVKGTPWMKLLPQKSQTENLEILMKVADAVGFAHARSVIHRDLKPENVMLGDFGEVLVMDWGLALPAPGYEKNDTISPAHSMGGTPAYMAPEMASGPLEKITFASDVYLLGAILYEILTGRPPHSGKNTMQCLFAAAKNDIRPTDKTGELIDISLRAMSTEPSTRYATVRAFQDAIRDYQSHTESIVLSSRAAEEMHKAQESDDYRDYSRSLFAFEESLALWDGNVRARTGLGEIRLKYAESALRKGDFDLGASLLDANDPAQAPLYAKLKEAQSEREARNNRLQTLKRVAVGMAAMFVVGVTVAFFWIKSEKDRAVVAEKEARTAETAAIESQKKEETAKVEAVKQKEIANDKEQIAVAAKLQSEKDKTIAVEAKGVAEVKEKEARVAEKAALEAKKKEEYEAYIARIGLAAARIDENAFEGARTILKECETASPDLLNWEWGRLMYLCGQSVREVDADAPLDSVAYSPDGSKFVTGGWNRAATVWETATGKKLLAIQHEGREGLYVYAAAFSPKEPLIATGSSDKDGFLRLCDSETGKVVRKFEGHTDAVLSVAFSKDGKRLLSTSYDKTARLWDVATGRELQTFEGHNWWVWSGAFSADESEIVTASQDGSVIVWATSTGKQKGQFLGHRGPVYSVAFAPDGRVATGGYDKRILIWKPAELRPFAFGKLVSGEAIKLPPIVALEGHAAGVRSVAFSKEGNLVLSGSHDNTVKVWEAESGRVLKTFRGHDSWVRSCAFSPDQRTVLSVSHDHMARLWSITDYEEVRVLQGRVLHGHDDAVMSAAFSRDGESIVTASRDRTARTWNFQTGEETRSFVEGHAFLASNAVFYPDGKRLLTAAVDNTVRIWDVTSGSQSAKLERTGRSAAVALSHDGRRVLTGSDDKTAKIWDADTGALLTTLEGHRFEITAVAFSPNDKQFFTGDANGTGYLWDAATAKVIHRMKSHTGKIVAAVFLDGGERLLTASNDKTVGQWDVATGRERVELVLRHPEAVLSLAVVPGTRTALTSCDDPNSAKNPVQTVRLWDLDSAKELSKLPVKGTINAVSVSANGRTALTANSEERTVRLWDLAGNREIETPAAGGKVGAFLEFKLPGSQLWTAQFAPDGDSVLTVGGTDARLWDGKGAKDGKAARELISFSPHGIVSSAGFSPDGSHIVTGSWDNSARVWNSRTGKDELKLVGQHKSDVNAATYSPNGLQILTASDDSTAVLWNARTGEVEKVLVGHTSGIRSAVYSPDGKRVLTASNDKTARLWDVATGNEIGRFTGHKWAVLSAAFMPDAAGSRIITGSEDNTARIWKTDTQELLLTLEGHTASVSSVAFLPHDMLKADKAPAGERLGIRVLTGSLDNTAKLWDGVTGKEILTLKGHSQEVTCVGASPSGRYLLTGSRDTTALVWLTTDWTQPAAAAQAALRQSRSKDEEGRRLASEP